MAFQLSPGVNVSEVDLTAIVPSVSTSTGAFSGEFSWGPTREVITITSESQLVSRFGEPNSSNYESWFSAANFLSYGGNLRVVRAANTTSTVNASANGAGILIDNELDYLANHLTANTSNGPFTARYAGATGNTLRVSICTSNTAFSSNLTVSDSIRANAQATSQTVININGTANAGANLIVGDLVSFDAGTTYIRVASVNATAIILSSNTSAAIATGTPILRKWQYADQFGVAPGTSDYTTNAGAAGGDELHVIVVDEKGLLSNGIANTVLEKYAFASRYSDAKNADGSSNYYVTKINDQSEYVWWTGHQPGATAGFGNTSSSTVYSELRVPYSASFGGGYDGTIGDVETIAGYNYFANADAVDASLMVSGSGNATVATSLISLCETRKDCMVFLSPTKSSVVNNYGGESTAVTNFRSGLTSSSFAVLDSGYKYQYDRYNDVYRWVPLNGDIAGLCARTDQERDPWYSPGGFNRGLIKNSIKLSWNPTKAERDALYVVGVNPVVSFPGEGTVLYGDKTLLSRPSVFDRINVRRLFIVLEKAIARAARNSMFEFNDQFTRSQFVNLIEPFLRDVQGRRGITDFRIICDGSNNTSNIIDLNQFVGDIYIKPARSVNFVQLNFVAVRSGVSFEEIVGRF